MLRYRPLGAAPEDRRLDRLVPDDWRHVERWPLTANVVPDAPVPVTFGINWYTGCDTPEYDESDRRWWVARRGLGSLRGGHAICGAPGKLADSTKWWEFYDQGREGACVGFASSRMMTLLNRKRYNARWLWNKAKEVDQWPETVPGDDNGTSVRAAMDILRTLGHVPYTATRPEAIEGIAAVRWARTVDEVHAALKNKEADRIGAVPWLNSWGEFYPRKVWIPDERLATLLDEDGEAAVVTDR